MEPSQLLPSEEPRKRLPLFLKIILWAAGVIIVLLILLRYAVPPVLGIIFRDSPPTTYPDLTLPAVTISDSDNMLPELINIDTLYPRTSTVQELSSTTQASIVSAFTAASGKPYYQDSVSADPSMYSAESPLPPLNGIRNAAFLNAVYAAQLAHQGHGSEGLHQAMFGVQVAKKIEVSQSPFLEQLVAIAIKDRSLLALQEIATSSTINSADLISSANALPSYVNDASGLIKSQKLDFTAFSRAYLSISTAKTTVGGTNYFYHPNETIELRAHFDKKTIGNFSDDCTPALQSHIAAFDNEVAAFNQKDISYYLKPNLVGRTLIAVTLTSLSAAKQKECNENMLLGATQLTLALKAYTQDKHSLPTSLHDLVPSYLQVLPNDPFSGQPFKYDTARKIFYSIGQTYKDVGGNPSSTWNTAVNPTFSIN